jgi:hypothetical protein
MKLHRHVPRIAVVLAVALAAGCSKSPDSAQHAQDAPLVAAPAAPAITPQSQILRGELTTADTHVSYDAIFKDGHLSHVLETRGTQDPAHQGDYEFYGARLLHYKGGTLSDGTIIELEFNMQGALTSTHAPRGVTTEEVAAVRTRAELLRNHALAEESVRSHRTQ